MSLSHKKKGELHRRNVRIDGGIINVLLQSVDANQRSLFVVAVVNLGFSTTSVYRMLQ